MTSRLGQHRAPLLAAAGLAAIVALLGVLATDLGDWYQSLLKPDWQPPDMLFGPAWTVIYGLAACAAVLSVARARTPPQRLRLLSLFACNVVLAVLWSVLFFRFQRPDLAFFEVFLLWMAIVALIAGVWPYSRLASVLLLPYLGWVTFAQHLNLNILVLNSPLLSVG